MQVYSLPLFTDEYIIIFLSKTIYKYMLIASYLIFTKNNGFHKFGSGSQTAVNLT